ncbi:MAG TPA: hypothetical protein VH158_06890 [Gemmatimonadales bacterium]|jgi:hypothetical protein|nr:hypothetical protein [Gemmatimonadales bacterium]
MLTPWLALGTVLAVQAPDSAPPTRYDAAFATFIDSLSAVDGAVAAFQADLGSASPDLVLARARRLELRCGAARRAGTALAGLLAGDASRPSPSSAERRARRDLDALERVLEKCERDYDIRSPSARPDTLKAWGPFRLNRLQGELRRYGSGVRLLQRRPSAP